MDSGILFQQNPNDLTIVILLLEARSNRLQDVAPLVDEAKTAPTETSPGDVIRVRFL